MISIIIPVYNQAEKLIKTLNSISRQSYPDFEVIIINDGSTDQLEKIFADHIKGLSENKYLFVNQENMGAPAARNRGYALSKGEYLFFCDADAVLEPVALETLLESLQQHPEAGYAYPSFYWGRHLFKVGEFSADRLKAGPYIHTMALIRRSDFVVAGWDESLKKFQDWDLWLSLLEAGKVGIWVPQVLFKVSTGGTISNWLPAFAYKLLPFLPTVKKYRAALKIIKDKHALA